VSIAKTIKSANVRGSFAIGAIVRDTECMTGGAFDGLL
jgi:hypothetical protein